ncbi:MAG: HEPN domain-containing protein [Thermotogota bacterium]|nr:HEPN domain-containing protein [Thermotogota bacterium]
MTKIDKTKSQLEKLFRRKDGQESTELPKELRILSLIIYAGNYKKAAEIIENESPDLFIQSLHLWGQSIELGLKAFILSKNNEPKEVHDLVKLTRKAEELGLSLTQLEISSVVLLNHYFFEDLATQTKYKTRYPTKSEEHLGGPVPPNEALEGIFNSLISQSNSSCENIDLRMYL